MLIATGDRLDAAADRQLSSLLFIAGRLRVPRGARWSSTCWRRGSSPAPIGEDGDEAHEALHPRRLPARDATSPRDLYHRVAKDLPIIDYHCHLLAGADRGRPPLPLDHRDLARGRPLQVARHARERRPGARSAPGTPRTGRSSRRGRAPCPRRSRNPLYHWTHMELRRPFGIDELLERGTARGVFDRCNDAAAAGRLHGARPARAVQGRGRLHHRRPRRLARAPRAARQPQGPGHARLPDLAARQGPRWSRTSRPGTPGSASSRRRQACRSAAGTALLEALETRHAFFHERGCRASDHGLERLDAEPCTDAEAQALFARLRAGRALEAAEARAFRSALLHRLALLDHARGWVQQFHLGAHAQQQHAHAPRCSAPTPASTRSATSSRAARSRASSTASTRATSSRKTILYNLNPRRQRAARHDGRQLPGRQRARQDAVRLGLVVPRPARRHGGPDARARRTWACCRASSA